LRQANRRTYHYIYKTTCKVTGRYYIGMHSTDDLNDGYVGSGKQLWYSINKHGLDNHVCVILEFLPDRDTLRKREAALVCEDQLVDPMCMNLKLGGEGGWDHVQQHDNHKTWCRKGYDNSQPVSHHHSKMSTDVKYKKKVTDKIVATKMERYGHAGRLDAKFQPHTDESKRIIGDKNAIHQVGSGNSQFGTCWIYHVAEQRCMKIPKENVVIWQQQGWLIGRKMKFI